jgi:hypothetical protein
MIHPALGDDPLKYPARVYVEGAGFRLPQSADGRCSYLKDNGCSIYNDRPALCRAFDCRVYAVSKWAALDPLRDDDVIERGLELGAA